MEMKEDIKVYVKGRTNPFEFNGEYKGHTRPDGKEAPKWHYYKSENNNWYHFRKKEIQVVISRSIE